MTGRHLMMVLPCVPRLREIVAEAIAGGVSMIQLRDKVASAEDLREAAAMLREVAGGGALLLVNSDAALAREVGADGVHLPESGVTVREARTIVGGERLIGCSVHSVEAARRAEDEGADYVVAGTIYASASHPELAPAGLAYLRQVGAQVSIPVIAIGGITPENAEDCLRAGARGVAVLSPLLQAANPRAVAEAYRQALERAI